MDFCAPTHLVLFSVTISNEIFCCSFFWSKILFLCAYHISKTYFIPQPHGQKSCRRQPQCSNTLCEGLCIWPKTCCPLQPLQMRYFVVHFWSKTWYLCAYHISKTNFILQPYEQKSCRRVRQGSNTLCGGYCIQPKESSPLEPFQIREFELHFAQKSCYLFAYLPQRNQVFSSTAGTKKC